MLGVRDPYAYVNGQTFVEGFGAFIFVVLVVLGIGWLVDKRQREYEDRGYFPPDQDEDNYFQKIEDFRNDFH